MKLQIWFGKHWIQKSVNRVSTYEGVSKRFRTGRLERELQMLQLSATRCSCIAILWVNLVSFVAITLCVASQWMFIDIVVISLWLSPETFGYTRSSFLYSTATKCIYLVTSEQWVWNGKQCSDCDNHRTRRYMASFHNFLIEHHAMKAYWGVEV
jgi:hypothetical protein